MAEKCELSSISECGKYAPQNDANFYAVDELCARNISEIYPELKNDPFYESFNEKWLIEQRSKVQLGSTGVVCAKHRHIFGVNQKEKC